MSSTENFEPTVFSASVRQGNDEIHIECRFSDGQKFAAIVVDEQFPDLANSIAEFLNRTAASADAQGVAADALAQDGSFP